MTGDIDVDGRRDSAAIAHHYDLSNEFYQLLLEEHMAYSSAYFTEPAQSLHDAQTATLDMICRKLDLKQGLHLLDVGCAARFRRQSCCRAGPDGRRPSPGRQVVGSKDAR